MLGCGGRKGRCEKSRGIKEEVSLIMELYGIVCHTIP